MTDVGNVQAGTVEETPGPRRSQVQVVPLRGLPIVAAPAALTAVSAALALTSGFLLSRLEQFAWPRFFLAFRWALLAYVISAGMIGFAFVRDHTRGAPLALVIVMLVIFALDVPVVIAFTVARYSSPPYASS
jgi:hypothetical protein